MITQLGIFKFLTGVLNLLVAALEALRDALAGASKESWTHDA
jgi:hypothetical protein